MKIIKSCWLTLASKILVNMVVIILKFIIITTSSSCGATLAKLTRTLPVQRTLPEVIEVIEVIKVIEVANS